MSLAQTLGLANVTSLATKMGIDRSVAYTFLARLTAIAGSTGTVLLIVHHLTSVQQGYYYTLLSLVSLQVVFEMGFSFVIQQLAAHECIHLHLASDGRVTGEPLAHARLAATLQLTVRWYTLAAVAMGGLLAPCGILLFRHQPSSAVVAWQAPWLLAVAASMAGLWCTPLYAFLEGCGQVGPIAAMRLRQAVAAAAGAWLALILGWGLYAPAAVIVAQTLTGLHFLRGRDLFLRGLLTRRHESLAVLSPMSWVREVWSFQWRLAVSSTCAYFTAQVFVPILFALRGPVEAGQIGMSLSVTGYMTTLVLAWTSTKATPFGRLIARGEFQVLDRLFFRALFQSLAAFSAIALASFAAVLLIRQYSPHLSTRLVAPGPFVLLVIAAGANCVMQSVATLLRSFKSEPFLLPSLAVATLTLLLAALTASRWGSAGAAFGCFVTSSGIGLPAFLFIFFRARRRYLGSGLLAVGTGSPE